MKKKNLLSQLGKLVQKRSGLISQSRETEKQCSIIWAILCLPIRVINIHSKTEHFNGNFTIYFVWNPVLFFMHFCDICVASAKTSFWFGQLTPLCRQYVSRDTQQTCTKVFELLQASFAGCAQTLPDTTPPKGKIHPFSKTAVTFEPMMQFL